ncbi:DUF983 domain-containing protein [Flavobacterium sp.]|jgi:uncharacterized protein (DUF983 family)|uniref:DUF983 domain-containing protein n=1 Tax=Flavobacterium sp. TaxID=239 RepID=UPI003F6A48E6
MLKKGSKLNSILTGSCPKCQEESMYLENNPYKISSIYKMHENCSHCGLKYSIEPSFFYGAMYVSYGLGVAFAIAAYVISYVILETTVKTAFISIIVTLIVLLPVMMRYSRNIWINMFVSFEKNWKDKLKKETK